MRISRLSSSGATEPRHVEQGEDRGVREQAGEREQHLLAAAHPGQPVVDERDLQLHCLRGGGHRPAERLHVAGVDRAHRALPAEGRGAQQAALDEPAPQLDVVEHARDPVRDRLLAVGVDEQRPVADDLRQRGDARGDDRRAAGHRLERGQAEALVERGEGEDRGHAVERGERAVRDEAEEAHVRPQPGLLDGPAQRAVAADVVADQHQAQVLATGLRRARARRRGSDARGSCAA